MRVRYWGTRGSLAKPGPDTLEFGGNTSCIEVRSDSGTLLVLDCGTGSHNLGQALLAEAAGRPVNGHLLISHTHWDHIQGIPFFAPLFVPNNSWHVYAPQSLSQSIRDTLAGQMQYTYFPITLEDLGADITYHDLMEGQFVIGDITVRCRFLNHPALTLGYRIEVDGAAVVYACDHEPLSDQTGDGPVQLGDRDRRHLEFLRDADLVIHDAQYTAAEYPSKVGWGHSTGEYALEVCRAAGVRQLAITHYDPTRTDAAVEAILGELQATAAQWQDGPTVTAAREGASVELRGEQISEPEQRSADFDSTEALAPSLEAQRVLLCSTDETTAALLEAACAAEGLALDRAHSVEGATEILDSHPPSVVLVDDNIATASNLQVVRSAQDQAAPDRPQAPIVVLTDRRKDGSPLDDVATDWITRPFSEQYARTRLRAWVLRRAARWVRAGKPAEEEQRLAAVNDLGILDTEPEPRFDRITRIAAAALDVPIALISVVDSERQWFKSCVGLEATETSRDAAFCAHAILEQGVMVVPDAHQDPRFAENPLVTGPPHVRFYAGCPLHLPGGEPLGTLCVLDTLPRHLDAERMQLLNDLATLVEAELR